MSTCCTCKWTEEPSTPVVGEAEPIQGLTSGELLIPPPPSVDSQQRPEVLAPEHPDELHAQDYGNQGELMIPSPNSVETQQSPEVLALEHLEEPYAQAYGAQTVPSRIQLPLRAARPSCTAAQGLSPSQLAGMSATQGTYSPQGIGLGSGSWQNLSDVTSDPEPVSLAAGDTEEDKDFIIPTSELCGTSAWLQGLPLQSSDKMKFQRMKFLKDETLEYETQREWDSGANALTEVEAM
ncbi:hypothetical protein M422DRAFT_269131 [Sphaerobolus stellatus SS14]|uniref:Uncharacterized protein n=1 Tax=Sphaerobolus stellatus (strain SS14) TaxID=990650 RepID=A0A0C9U5E9_SPHS4|nr:hypothetical protein M422DRAFT_269131 [Sphaerobolus stellatus SS14]